MAGFWTQQAEVYLASIGYPPEMEAQQKKLDKTEKKQLASSSVHQQSRACLVCIGNNSFCAANQGTTIRHDTPISIDSAPDMEVWQKNPPHHNTAANTHVMTEKPHTLRCTRGLSPRPYSNMRCSRPKTPQKQLIYQFAPVQWIYHSSGPNDRPNTMLKQTEPRLGHPSFHDMSQPIHWI